jgi:hypothetical protein
MAFFDKLKRAVFRPLPGQEAWIDVNIDVQAGMMYHAIANSAEPAFKNLHFQIQKFLREEDAELVDGLINLKITFNGRRKLKPKSTGENAPESQ